MNVNVNETVQQLAHIKIRIIIKVSVTVKSIVRIKKIKVGTLEHVFVKLESIGDDIADDFSIADDLYTMKLYEIYIAITILTNVTSFELRNCDDKSKT